MLNTELSQRNKEVGMERSEKNAGSTWAKDAYKIFVNYCGYHAQPFLVEEVREIATMRGLTVPPSKRAWGSIVARAKKDKIIQHVGYGQVSNPLAHQANASKWKSLIYMNI